MISRARSLSQTAFLLGALLAAGSSATGTTRDDVGYTTLSAELNNVGVPNGAGVKVTQVEAPLTFNGNDYEPDTTNPEFSGKSFTFVNSGTTSSHATTVGRYFYGSAISISPGITNIEAYNANAW